MIGTKLAHFTITAHLGSGGMGDVYQATDSKLGRNVAIKLLPEAFMHDTNRVARFEREARVLASLNHPNIAAIYGIEQSGERKLLVMELVLGETLAERIKRGPIPVNEALAISKQIAAALEAAHDSEKAIIHRDLKPANVKITPDGKVKVLDFGLAKAMESAPANVALSDSPTLSRAATQAGIILGTASYMSPEQARGLAADARSDIFSLGCVLYEMLTGRQAFQGETVADVLAGVLAREPDLSGLPASLNPRITDLLRRSIEKNPKRRWYAAADVRGEIEAILADPRGVLIRTEPVLSKPPLWKRAIPIVIALLAGIVIGGVALWNGRPTSPLAVTRFSFTLPNDQQFTSSSRQLVSISPDGTQLVYVANNQLYLKSSSAQQSVPIEGTDLFPGIQNPTFSPDARFLAFWSADGTLKRIPVRGGAAITICKADPPFGMSWGRNDEIVFGAGPKGIMRVSANGGTPETIVPVVGSENMHGPQTLPGGKALLFTAADNTVGLPGPARWDEAKIVVQFLESGERKTIIVGGSDARYVPTGHIVYVLRGSLLAIPFDVDRTEVTGPPVPLVEGVRVSSTPGNSNTGTAQFSFSDGGTLVYIPEPASNSQRQLALVDQNGKIKPLDVPAKPYLYPRISPDGKQLSVTTDDLREAITWLYPLSGATSLRRLTFGGRNDNAVWSGDGQWLIMRSNREGAGALFRQRADGTGAPERVTEIMKGKLTSQSPGSGYWSGPNQMFTLTTDSEYDLWTFSMAEKKATPFDNTPGSEQLNGGFSPDGQWVAYSSNETGRFEIYVRSFSGSKAKFQITREGGAHPQWASNGRELYFDNNGTVYSVAIQSQPTLTWSNPVALPISGFYQPDVRPRHYDLSPDGKHFVMIFSVQALTKTTEPVQIQYVLNWFEELRQKTSK